MLHHMLHYMLHRIGELDRIVMMKGKWLKMIYNKKKDIEVRNNGKTVLGLRIFFCESGTSIVSGYAVVADVLGPLSSQDWDRIGRACVTAIASQEASFTKGQKLWLGPEGGQALAAPGAHCTQRRISGQSDWPWRTAIL